METNKQNYLPTQEKSDLTESDKQRLEDFFGRALASSKTFIGYPCNLHFDYTDLHRFFSLGLNNVGDPFATSIFQLNTFEFEKEVIESFADFTNTSTVDTWGYVTNGGSEGNLYGLYLARELYPSGIVYYSEDTHYSVAKSIRLLNARSIMIKSQTNGEIDYVDLHETLKTHRDLPAIIFANIGTTMKGAVDDITQIKKILEKLAITSYYIHSDAALSGMILPFVQDPQPWDFLSGIHSISISGHKMIGSPIPCGIVLAKKKFVERIARSVEYVGVLDTTIPGSRNAITPLYLWYALHRYGREGFRRVIRTCLDVAEYAIEHLHNAGIVAWRNNNSITVVFPRPSDRVLKKWQIAPYREISHLITMPHVTTEHIDGFIQDYLNDPPNNTLNTFIIPTNARPQALVSGEHQ